MSSARRPCLREGKAGATPWPIPMSQHTSPLLGRSLHCLMSPAIQFNAHGGKGRHRMSPCPGLLSEISEVPPSQRLEEISQQRLLIVWNISARDGFCPHRGKNTLQMGKKGDSPGLASFIHSFIHSGNIR